MADTDSSPSNRLSVSTGGGVLDVKICLIVPNVNFTVFEFCVLFVAFYLSICTVTEHYEGVERSVAGQPDLFQRTVPGEENFTS